jgi:hypothetical protein
MHERLQVSTTTAEVAGVLVNVHRHHVHLNVHRHHVHLHVHLQVQLYVRQRTREVWNMHVHAYMLPDALADVCAHACECIYVLPDA